MHLLVSVWGKGGVGKSTIAAAITKLLTEAGFDAVLVSTDVFPSLLRLLDLDPGLAGRWVAACGFKLLCISEELAARMWRRRFGDEVYQVLSTLFDVPKDELLDYLEKAPWILEQMHLAIVIDALEEHEVVVWDTMGAGGGLLMLEVEHRLYQHLRLAPRIYARAKGLNIAKLIDSWRRLAEKILDAVKSPSHKPLVVIEAYTGAWQATDMLKYLKPFRKPHALIVNKVVTQGPLSDTTMETLKQAERIVKDEGIRLYTVPYITPPPKGCRGVERVAKHLKDLARWLTR